MVVSELIKLEVNKREATGKQAMKRLRAEGFTAGIIYGLKRTPQPVSFNERMFAKMLHQAAGKSLIEVTVDGETEPVVILEVQREPLTQVVIHVDFKRLDLSKMSEFEVRLEFVGEPLGARTGGLTNVIEDTILIECLPTELPNEIEVNITGLDVGDGLHARDIQLQPGMTLKTEPDAMLVNVVAPAAEEVAAVVEEVEEEVPEGEEPEEGAPKHERESHKEDKKD